MIRRPTFLESFASGLLFAVGLPVLRLFRWSLAMDAAAEVDALRADRDAAEKRIVALTERAETAERHLKRAMRDGAEAVNGWTRTGKRLDAAESNASVARECMLENTAELQRADATIGELRASLAAAERRVAEVTALDLRLSDAVASRDVWRNKALDRDAQIVGLEAAIAAVEARADAAERRFAELHGAGTRKQPALDLDLSKRRA